MSDIDKEKTSEKENKVVLPFSIRKNVIKIKSDLISYFFNLLWFIVYWESFREISFKDKEFFLSFSELFLIKTVRQRIWKNSELPLVESLLINEWIKYVLIDDHSFKNDSIYTDGKPYFGRKIKMSKGKMSKKKKEKCRN